MSASTKSKISDRVQAIPRSGIREFFELVLNAGDVISLGVGEPDFSTPWPAILGMIRGFNKAYISNDAANIPRVVLRVFTISKPMFNTIKEISNILIHLGCNLLAMI